MDIVTPKEVHQYAVEKGWWENNDRPIPELLCLLHSEISEALEAYRNRVPYGDKGCFEEELADLVIRVWDLCGAFNIDIAAEVNKKHQTNLERPYRHGNKRC
jgi:NTP pyrophosphatase (non-canonical NTP hydrolase)